MIERKYRGRAAHRFLITVVFVGLVAMSTKEAMAVSCYKGFTQLYASVPCGSPQAVFCGDVTGTPTPGTGTCPEAGFTQYLGWYGYAPELNGYLPDGNGWAQWYWMCPGGTPGCGAPPAVPELSEWAAIVFIGLTLLFGWRIRSSYRPAG